MLLFSLARNHSPLFTSLSPPLPLNSQNHIKMKADLFAFLPSEIIIHILLRLPFRTIISCKCVCKSWLALLETPYFVEAHLRNAVPGLAVYDYQASLYKLSEFEDGLDLENHNLHYRSVTNFNIPLPGVVAGSINGLLFLCNWDTSLYVCNPVSRNYIKLDVVGQEDFANSYWSLNAYGFGLSIVSYQYKVVSIAEYISDPPGDPIHNVLCHVYTIGTGSWRRKLPANGFVYHDRDKGAFQNGNLHWLVSDSKFTQIFISCFDLEIELFSTFTPPILGDNAMVSLTTLGDSLCLCDYRFDKIEIWLMREYGVEESWTKHLSICKGILCDVFGIIYSMKVFKDGDILMALTEFVLYYSRKRQMVQELDLYERDIRLNPFFYAPSFLSLRTFEMENVASF